MQRRLNNKFMKKVIISVIISIFVVFIIDTFDIKTSISFLKRLMPLNTNGVIQYLQNINI